MDIIIKHGLKHARIEIKPDGSVRVIAPPHVNVDELVQRRRAWIERKRERLYSLIKDSIGLEDKLLLNGRFLELRLGQPLSFNNGYVVARDYRELKEWMRQKLKRELEQRIRVLSLSLGVRPNSFAVRVQRRKWASCSSKGNLSFNLKIMALPGTLREYIVIHELAHLKIPNHSKRFWKLVEEYYPEREKADEELERYWLLIERNEVWNQISAIKT